MKKIFIFLITLFLYNCTYSQIIFEMISPEDSLVNDYLKTGSVLKLDIKCLKKIIKTDSLELKIHNLDSGIIDSVFIGYKDYILLKLDINSKYNISCYYDGFLNQAGSYIGYINNFQTNNINKVYTDSFRFVIGTNCFFGFNKLYFDNNKHFIRPDARSDLKQTIHVLNKYKKIVVEINSFSDCTEKNPLELSMKRSKALVDYLVSKGIDSTRLKSYGYGATQSKTECDCSKKCTEEQLQYNRRTEFKIISFK